MSRGIISTQSIKEPKNQPDFALNGPGVVMQRSLPIAIHTQYKKILIIKKLTFIFNF